MTKKKNIVRQSATAAASRQIRVAQANLKKSRTGKTARALAAAALTAGAAAFFLLNPDSYEQVPESSLASPVENVSEQAPSPLGESTTAPSETPTSSETSATETSSRLALDVLNDLPVKGRAPKTGYQRTEFYNSWPTIDGCSLRQRILARDLGDSVVISSSDNCAVLAGAFTEPYTGKYLEFTEKSQISSGLQIDHIVALSDAWQKGAQNLSKSERYNLATDPLNLLAVDASTNQQKSDGDASTWLPANKSFRCIYVARQVSVKYKYSLWVSSAEKNAITNVLSSCPTQPAVGI